jgi:hypothetical protein
LELLSAAVEGDHGHETGRGIGCPVADDAEAADEGHRPLAIKGVPAREEPAVVCGGAVAYHEPIEPGSEGQPAREYVVLIVGATDGDDLRVRLVTAGASGHISGHGDARGLVYEREKEKAE